MDSLHLASVLLRAFVFSLSFPFLTGQGMVYLYGNVSRIFGDPLFHCQEWVMHHEGGTIAILPGPLLLRQDIPTRYTAMHSASGKWHTTAAFLTPITEILLTWVQAGKQWITIRQPHNLVI